VVDTRLAWARQPSCSSKRFASAALLAAGHAPLLPNTCRIHRPGLALLSFMPRQRGVHGSMTVRVCVSVGGRCTPDPLFPRAVGAVESVVAREYGQPVASYRDIVWPERDNPPLDLALAWKAGPDTSGLHPDASTHELLADVVKHALWQLLLRWPSMSLPLALEQKADASSENGSRVVTIHHSPSPPPWARVKIPYGGTAQLQPSLRCASASLPAAPLSPDTIASSSCVGVPSAVTVGAEDGAAFEAAPISRSSAGWSFSAEKPDKPRAWLGTIASDDGGNEPLPWIAFPIVFRVPHRAGKLDHLTFFPQLEVTFLRSY
jgi:hypothetical protein